MDERLGKIHFWLTFIALMPHSCRCTSLAWLDIRAGTRNPRLGDYLQNLLPLQGLYDFGDGASCGAADFSI